MTDKTEKARVIVYVPTALATEITRRAAADHRSVSGWVAQHLAQTLETPADVEQPRREAIADLAVAFDTLDSLEVSPGVRESLSFSHQRVAKGMDLPDCIGEQPRPFREAYEATTDAMREEELCRKYGLARSPGGARGYPSSVMFDYVDGLMRATELAADIGGLLDRAEAERAEPYGWYVAVEHLQLGAWHRVLVIERTLAPPTERIVKAFEERAGMRGGRRSERRAQRYARRLRRTREGRPTLGSRASAAYRAISSPYQS